MVGGVVRLGVAGMTVKQYVRKAERPLLVPPLLPRRRLHFVRIVAVLAALIAVGGLCASVYGYWQVGHAERVVRDELHQSSDTFTQVATSLRSASDSALHAAGTIDDAKVSLTNASTTVQGLAGTLDQTGNAINVTIPGFGARPFAGVQGNFRDQANQFRDLAGTIDHTRDSLSGNAGDLRAIGTNVGTLATTMQVRATQLNDFAGNGPGEHLSSITNPMRVLLAWSVVMHLLLLGFAASLFILTTPHHHAPPLAPRIRVQRPPSRDRIAPPTR